MHSRLNPMPHIAPRQQRGITLIESLAAIVVAALGIVGVLGMQMRTLSDTQTSAYRAQAIRLIEDLSERMKTHPNALGNIDSYTVGWRAGPAPTPQAAKLCQGATECTHAEFAAYDLREWKRTLERSLPLGDAAVFFAPAETVAGSRRQLGVMIRWRENERSTDNAYLADLLTTANNLGGDAGAPLCNASPTSTPRYTCHLQYIPVGSRCAPYFADFTVKYFCPGPQS
ncbi:type IV pilus modification protein PilV [Acidovorax sp. sif0632]|nr:type IV pilus modification protein PilV [Acidovorax sp. sif0632]MBV7466124.1 type IV pilus modification protein PilV [Acidovorax sp. sif0613]